MKKHIFNNLEILHEYEIPRIGWEMDNTGYIVKDNEGRIFCMESSHGHFYEEKKYEEEFSKKIKEAQSWIEGYQKALSLLRRR